MDKEELTMFPSPHTFKFMEVSMFPFPLILPLLDMESISKLSTLNSQPTSQSDRTPSATALSSHSLAVLTQLAILW
jgi:hypothetical protein